MLLFFYTDGRRSEKSYEKGIDTMQLQVSAQEMCTMCVMAWPGPLPPFKGVQGVLPYGVKNVIKWKSQMGLNKLIHNQHDKLVKQKIWGSKEYNSMFMAILFFKHTYTFEDSNKDFITFYEGIENDFASICSKDNDEYEIVHYSNREEWTKAVKQTYQEVMGSENKSLFTVMHHRGDTEKLIIDRYSAADWELPF